MALLVYDMQVGIAKQLPNAAEFIQQVQQVVDWARSLENLQSVSLITDIHTFKTTLDRVNRH
jgi:hypothetical protein